MALQVWGLSPAEPAAFAAAPSPQGPAGTRREAAAPGSPGSGPSAAGTVRVRAGSRARGPAGLRGRRVGGTGPASADRVSSASLRRPWTRTAAAGSAHGRPPGSPARRPADRPRRRPRPEPPRAPAALLPGGGGPGPGPGPAWMAATSRRRRRICCRSAGAWATAAPPPRSPPRPSRPESSSRRRCPWPRTQVSARGGGGCPAPSLSLPGSGAGLPGGAQSPPRGRADGPRGPRGRPGVLSPGSPAPAPPPPAPGARAAATPSRPRPSGRTEGSPRAAVPGAAGRPVCVRGAGVSGRRGGGCFCFNRCPASRSGGGSAGRGARISVQASQRESQAGWRRVPGALLRGARRRGARAQRALPQGGRRSCPGPGALRAGSGAPGGERAPAGGGGAAGPRPARSWQPRGDGSPWRRLVW